MPCPMADIAALARAKAEARVLAAAYHGLQAEADTAVVEAGSAFATVSTRRI